RLAVLFWARHVAVGDASVTGARDPWSGRSIVLRTVAVRESDLVLTLLSAERGRIDAIARGARKSRRRFPGGLPVGARGEAELRRGRGRLENLERFEFTHDNAAIGRDLRRFGYVSYLCEITDQLVSGDGVERAIYAALDRALEGVLGTEPDPEMLRSYELKLLDHLGLLPSLSRCCACGGVVESGASQGVAYDVPRGGVLCREHAGRAATRLDPKVLLLTQALRSSSGPGVLADASVPVRRGVRDLCLQVVRQHLVRPLKSAEFFAQIARDQRSLSPG
ncbi:MAG: DNA repair protein RecO, partial [Nannocystaceae bacterium]